MCCFGRWHKLFAFLRAYPPVQLGIGLMKYNFEVGQLVKRKNMEKPFGFVIKVDKDWYGARQAFKVYGAQRGQVLKPNSVNGIGPTKDGIRDRVLVDWIKHGCEYIESHQLEVICESR
tara:strand:+ start:391 stop:744 length:354 start_codon:yes stop_codon:yes gene_type:complete